MAARILIIEDNLELAENLQEILELEDNELEVCLAPDGASGLQLLSTQPFDGVLTDMRMPGLNGSDVVREIRRLYPNLPTIVMTAYAEDDLLSDAKDWGAMDVLIKPVDISQLLAALRRYVAPATRILIVEDDQQLRTLLANYLSRFTGVAVTPASDLASALHLATHVDFHAAILDVNLPDGTSISKHTSLKTHLGDIPLIYITGHRDGALDAVPEGVEPPPIISKPFRPNELKDALKGVINP